ncbi:hypothetical protein TYRP_023022, partial [Tyrophagus putrescentiae]
MGFFVLYIDLILYFKFDARLQWMIYELFVLNGQKFRQLNIPVTFNTVNTIRQMLFLLHISQLLKYTITQHIAELNNQLNIAIKQSHMVIFKYRYLDFFYREYRALLQLSRHSDAQVVNELVLFGFIFNITLNLVAIGNLIFVKMSLPEQFVVFTIAILQIGISFTGCLQLISWSNAFCQSDKLLYTIQQVLESKQSEKLYKRVLKITAKLKLSIFYETVCSNDEFRFHMGNLGKISQKSLFEFIFLYSSFVLYVATMCSIFCPLVATSCLPLALSWPCIHFLSCHFLSRHSLSVHALRGVLGRSISPEHMLL